MTELIENDGKRWGLIAAVLANLPKAAKITARRIRDWIGRGLLAAHKMAGRGLYIVALEDVLTIEQRTRETVAKRGGTKRGTTRQKAAHTLA